MDKRIEELREAIERRINAKPETGEAWADICRLEDELVKLGGSY